MTDDLVKQMWGAYAKQAGGVTFDGKPLPTWDELGEERQSCWIAAASVAADRIEHLERELAEERHSREVSANTAWTFATKVSNLQAVLMKIASSDPDGDQHWPGRVARAALEAKTDD